jgi:cellulose synthase (UDP-forming)
MNPSRESVRHAGHPQEGVLTVRQDRLLPRLFSGSRRIAYFLGVLLWVAALAWFWTWWFERDHIIAIGPFALLSVIMAWVTLLPAYFIYLFAGSRTPQPIAHQRVAGRIAMVVTKAPSEPFDVVRRTLSAMLAQVDYDYDVWLADEAPDAETISWCAAHGVQISTRQGVAEYHRTTWPRRTRCKEGNLAYFYDHYGYDRYDFVAQFDADHAPDRTYLREIMRPFADPEVGYVSAPSICDSNATESWSARGRLQAEASMHGCLQIGYNNGWAPLCIGSHYAVRTAALKAVGGLGPELAEDHSTTLILNAGGWRGVHAVGAIAHGEGPRTFADLAIQEFQWSRSLVTILLRYSKDYVPKLSGKLRFQFIFSELWYPLFSVFMAAMFLLPIAALLTGRNFVNVDYPDFLMHFLPVSAVLVALAFYWRSTGTFRPHDARILGWESAIFLLARWPWSLAGTFYAVRDQLSGSFVDFRITPKGGKVTAFPPLRLLAPYLLLSVSSAAVALFVSHPGSAKGYYFFAIINAIVYGVVLAVIIIGHARENGLSLLAMSRSAAMTTATLALSVSVTTGAVYSRAAPGLEAVAHGQNMITFTETRFAVAGAGQGGSQVRTTHFRIKWHGLEPDRTGEVGE